MNGRRPVWVSMPGGSAARPVATERNPLRSEAIMHTDAQVRRAGGRLSREDQRRIGDILQRVYDDVLRQGVPERFKNLLNELGEPEHGSDKETPRDNAARAENDEPDRMMTATGSHHPNKGSH